MRSFVFFFLFLILTAGLLCSAEPVFIRMERTEKASAVRSLLIKKGARNRRIFSRLGWESWEPPPGISDSAFLASLKNLPHVKRACLSTHYELCDAFPNDPDFLTRQWALYSSSYPENDIDAPAAWDITTGTNRIVVAVIDSGIDAAHPDISPNLWQNSGEIPENGKDDDGNGYIDDISGWDFYNNAPLPYDALGHGTLVSGVIGAKGNNGIGVSGVCWNVRILPLKVFEGSQTTVEVILGAFDYILGMQGKIHIINASWGGKFYSPVLYDAISECAKRGILFSAAAGNEKMNTAEHPVYPASFNLPNVISVGATDIYGNLWSKSDYGPIVSVCAPGSSIYSTIPAPGYYGSSSGTSLAAPHVSGAAALLLSISPGLKPHETRNKIIGCAKEGSKWETVSLSRGILNLPNLFCDDAPQPSPVSDLTVTEIGLTTATLEFSLPYDNSPVEPVRIVELRYARFPLNEDSWWKAERVPILIEEGLPGEKRTALVQELLPGCLYFFGARSLDECGLQSALSNEAFAYTRSASVVFVENFENPDSGWDLSASRWDIATSPGLALSGERLLFHPEASGAYMDMDAAISPWIDLKGIREPYLVFSHQYEFYGLERLTNEGRVDILQEGENEWEALGRFKIFYSPWKRETFYLGNWKGGRIRIRFRFYHVFEFLDEGDEIGWWIDDVKILESEVSPEKPRSLILF
ncbi:S8 family serine peptidase [Candidatus Sumerlaeota bacterium]|nr:S8 family serine peptidase [Candidatus Sumerlaeota bacterium]